MKEIDTEHAMDLANARGRAVGLILLVGQLLGFGGAAYVLYFWTLFHINDSVAVSLTESGWRRMGLEHVLIGSIAALLCCGLSSFLSRLLVRGNALRRSLLTGAFLALLVFLVTCAAAIQFVREKPWF